MADVGNAIRGSFLRRAARPPGGSPAGPALLRGVLHSLCCLVLGGAIALGIAGLACAQVDEDALRAAYVFNFAKLVQWPRTRLPNPRSAIDFCVEDGALPAAAAQTLQNKTIGERMTALEIFKDMPPARCHVVVIGRDAPPGRLAALLLAARAQSMLTVSQATGFIDLGGNIELYEDDGKLRFKVNLAAAQAAGLQLSSRLLVLAETVVRKGG